MKMISTKLIGVVVLEPDIFEDSRGFFMESWSKKYMEENGMHYHFVQENHSLSISKGTLRGIHYQKGNAAQAKLVRCIRGAVFDVAVDLRKSSTTYRQWVGVTLSSKNRKQLLIPRGFGHGFITLEDYSEILYKVDNYYDPLSEGSILWNDATLGINWGTEVSVLSEKDGNAPPLRDALLDF